MAWVAAVSWEMSSASGRLHRGGEFVARDTRFEIGFAGMEIKMTFVELP
jgi:hypothetical protein